MTTKAPKATTTETAVAPTQKQQKQDDIRSMALPDTLGLSPAKPNGILMTPGTTRRNKTVTFGAQVVDNEGKKTSRSGLPNTFPGKFPSPWTPKTDDDGLSETSTASQKRTKLTQTLHEVRDSSSKNRAQSTKPHAKDDLDITLDFMEPRSQSGKYWKQQYDVYAEQTQREVKKLLHKNKAAKTFAKDKDQEVSDLTEKLRAEKTKADELEKRTKKLEKEMKDLKERFKHENGVDNSDALKDAQQETEKLRLENWKLREDLERTQGKHSKPQPSPRRRPASAADADLWADAMLSSPFVVEACDKSPERAMTSRRLSKSNETPLKSRDINILNASQHPSNSKRNDRTVELTPKRNFPRSTPRSSRDSHILPEDSIDMSVDLPQPSPDLISRPAPRSASRTPRSARKSAAEKTIDDLIDRYSPIKPLIMSSPPPKFDRLALPMGMTSTNSGPTSAQQSTLRKKPSLKESFAKAASPRTERIDAVLREDAIPTHEGKENEGQHHDMDKSKSQKRTIGEDRRLAALERIAARKAGKSQAR